MTCVAELVDRGDFFQAVAAAGQQGSVVGEGCRVARNRDDCFDFRVENFQNLSLGPGPRRVEDDGIERL